MSTHALPALTARSFEAEVLASPGPFLVEFSAPWCGACKVLAPVVAGVARELEGRLSVGVLDADENPEISVRYRVTALPTLILFAGGKEVARRIGTMSPKALRELVGGATAPA